VDPDPHPHPDPVIFDMIFKTPTKKRITKKFFCLLLFEGTFTSFFKDKKSPKVVTKVTSRNKGFSYNFCLMIEGSGFPTLQSTFYFILYSASSVLFRSFFNSDVQDELIYNICHPASGVRAVAYSCLVRLLRHAPTRWPAVLPGYMAALEVQISLKTPGITKRCRLSLLTNSALV
jgi:hypothetical protein